MPGGLLRRHTRRRLADASVSEQSDPFLSTLQNAIGKEIKGLQQLTSAIDDADTDDDQPINEAGLSQDNKGEGGHALSGTGAEQVDFLLLMLPSLTQSTETHAVVGPAPGMKQAQQHVQGANSTLGSAAVQQASSACWQSGEEEALLRSHMKQAGSRKRKQRKKAFAGFELSDVNQQIIGFLSPGGGSSNSLELPDFTKMQRMQVSYNLEHRVAAVVMPVACDTSGTALSAGTRLLTAS